MTRRAARLIWAALVATPFLFGAVTFTVARAPREQLAGPAFWLAAIASAVNVALSRLLPRRLGPRAAADRDVVAFSRLLVGFALCDAAAIAPLVAFVVTRDPRLLALAALDVLALILLYPTEQRWQANLPGPIPAGPGPRGVR
jgi:hypothetical protein